MNTAILHLESSLPNPHIAPKARSRTLGHIRRLYLGLLSMPIGFAACLVVAQTPTADNLNLGFDTDSGASAVVIQADGKMLLGGCFETLLGEFRPYIARLNADGTLDTGFTQTYTAFSPSIGGPRCLALQPDGKILVGGGTISSGGQVRSNIFRLNPNGTLDNNFDLGTNTSTGLMLLQADGKIVTWQWTLPERALGRVIRLGPTGILEPTYTNITVRGEVGSLALQSDGKVLVGCDNLPMLIAGQQRWIARINPDGTLDTTFGRPDCGLSLLSLVVQGDDKILVGGMVGWNGSVGVARFNAQGDPDNGFQSGVPDTVVYALAVQADGKILVGGTFTSIKGQARANIARLNADGSLDAEFNPGANGGVNLLAIQPDGKVLVGGSFTTLGGQARTNFGRLNATGPATQTLSRNGSTLTWLRGGTSPEVYRTTFEHSANGQTWTSLGAGSRIAGGWQLNVASLPANGTVRARGYVTGQVTAGWFVESTLALGQTSGLSILVNDGSFGFRTNRFGFNVSGTSGQTVVVEGSTNLLNWLPLRTNTLGSGPFYFSDPSGKGSRRFYRVRGS